MNQVDRPNLTVEGRVAGSRQDRYPACRCNGAAGTCTLMLRTPAVPNESEMDTNVELRKKREAVFRHAERDKAALVGGGRVIGQCPPSNSAQALLPQPRQPHQNNPPPNSLASGSIVLHSACCHPLSAASMLPILRAML